MTCERCFKPADIGEHGEGLCPYEPRARAHAIVPDLVPGGFVVENGFDQPTRFDSHSEHRAALAARGLEIRAKWAGERDTIMSNWAAGIDAQTMANAAELLSRGRVTVEPEPDPREEFPITVTEMTETFKYRVEP